MPGFPLGRNSQPIFPRRCKYCGNELEQVMIPRTVTGAEEHRLMRKDGLVATCPRCDAPSPPRQPEVSDDA